MNWRQIASSCFQKRNLVWLAVLCAGAAAVTSVSAYFPSDQSYRFGRWKQFYNEGYSNFLQGDHAKAEQDYQAAIAECQGTSQINLREQANTLKELGDLYASENKFDAAGPYYEQAADIFDKLASGEPKGSQYALLAFLDCVCQSAKTLQALGQNDRAEAQYKRGLAAAGHISDDTRPISEPLRARLLACYASLLKATNRVSDAGFVLGQARMAVEKQASDESGLSKSTRHLNEDIQEASRAYGSRGQAAGDEIMARALGELQKRVQSDPEAANELTSLGKAYQQQKRFVQAEGVFKQALTMREKEFGANSIKLEDSLDALANLYKQQQDKLAEAEEVDKRILEIRQQAYGPDDIRVGETKEVVAALESAQHHTEKARVMYRELLAAMKKKGMDSEDLYDDVLCNLGILCEGEHDYAQAEALFKEAINNEKKAVGHKYPTLYFAIDDLGQMFAAKKEYKKAVPFFQEALALLQNSDGDANLINIARLRLEQTNAAAKRQEASGK
jgi:Tfp pilus assembly protein PilF